MFRDVVAPAGERVKFSADSSEALAQPGKSRNPPKANESKECTGHTEQMQIPHNIEISSNLDEYDPDQIEESIDPQD